MSRDEFVYEAFVRRWAERYREVYKAKGELQARMWFKQFVHDDDKARVLAALQEEKKT